MKLKFWTKIILAIFVLTLVSGCIFLPKKDGYVKILVYNGDPNSQSSVVSSMETLFVGLDGLTPLNRYKITIEDSNGNIMAAYALNATEDGKLPPTAMWPDAGLPPYKDNGPANPNSDIQVGSYKIILEGEDDNTKVTFPFSVISRTTPSVWSSNDAGDIVNGFKENEDEVYATGMSFVPNRPVDIYIMRDRDTWNDGEFLDDQNVYVEKLPKPGDPDIMTDKDGKLHADLGVAAIDITHGNCNNFDIIVDANQDGILDPKDAVDGKNCAGYTVQWAPSPVYRTMQMASNGRALDYTTHWNDSFYYPDDFNQDGSGTGFPWEGFGHGVFCILNPLLDETDPNLGGLVPWQQVQIWVIRETDFANLAPAYVLTGLDVSDPQGRPDLVWVQRTCSNGAGSILIWQAPLIDRRGNFTIDDQEGFVVIVEKPDSNNNFDNIYDPNSDYIDGKLNGGDDSSIGFKVNVPLQ